MNSWIAVAGWTLIHFLWQGALIALAAAVVLRLLRRSAPQPRYVVACAALAAMVAAPLLTAATLMSASAGVTAGPAALSAAVEVMTVAAQRSVHVPPGGQANWWPAFDAAAWMPLIVVAWGVGVLALLARLACGWWRVRALHHGALRSAASAWQQTSDRLVGRLRLRRIVRVVDSLAVDTPAVIGWLRPVVLLPIAALANLTEEQVVAILVHELAHIRRHDLVVNLGQAVAETLLFYHPGVWWLSSRIRVEREHCCDDIAVAVAGNPVLYAEALTALASWSVTTSPLAVGAGGGSLLDRVRRVLGVEAAPRAGAHVTLAMLLAVAIVATGGLTVLLRAQVPDVMRFVHAGGPHEGRLGPLDVNRLLGYDLFPPVRAFPTDDPLGAHAWDVTVKYPGGQMPFIGFTGRGLIRYAYGAGAIPVVDAPAWLDTESVSLTVETAAAGADEATLRAAIRAALEQQLQIVTRRDTRDFDAYALVLADNGLGPNIHPTTSSCVDGRDLAAVAAARRRVSQLTLVCGVDHNLTGATGRRVTMGELATELRQPWLNRQVVDRTGLTGVFDYRLDMGLVPLAVIATSHPELAPALAPLGVTPMSRALEEQLGLKLEPAKVPFDVLAVERIEKP